MSGQERLMNVLLAPHVSEKGARLQQDSNQVVFRVRPDANKDEIRRAVELMFEVKVTDVRVSNVKGKVKRFGQRFGQRSDWKKAYVRLAEGQSIDMMGSEG
jgi:large subunit ribosomal protein L23